MPQARVQEALGRRFYPGPQAGPLLHQGSITSHPPNANLVSSGGRWRRCWICVARHADRQYKMCRARAEWRFGPWETWNCCMAAWPALVWLVLPLHYRDARPDPQDPLARLSCRTAASYDRCPFCLLVTCTSCDGAAPGGKGPLQPPSRKVQRGTCMGTDHRSLAASSLASTPSHAQVPYLGMLLCLGHHHFIGGDGSSLRHPRSPCCPPCSKHLLHLTGILQPTAPGREAHWPSSSATSFD